MPAAELALVGLEIQKSSPVTRNPALAAGRPLRSCVPLVICLLSLSGGRETGTVEGLNDPDVTFLQKTLKPREVVSSLPE